MKSLLHLPRDRLELAKLETQVRKMTSVETDRDVIDALKLATSNMDQIKLAINMVMC